MVMIFEVYFKNLYRNIRKWVKHCLISIMVCQQVHIQHRATRITLTNHGNRHYEHLSMASIIIGRLKLYLSQNYSIKKNISILVCLNPGQITPESICSLSSRYIVLAGKSIPQEDWSCFLSQRYCFKNYILETYHKAVKHIAQKVTELIWEELVKQGGIECMLKLWKRWKKI